MEESDDTKLDYSSWDEARLDMFKNEPNDALGRCMRQYIDSIYEYEAHEWHKVIAEPDTPANRKWATAAIRRNEERACLNAVMDWKQNWCPFCALIRKLTRNAELALINRLYVRYLIH